VGLKIIYCDKCGEYLGDLIDGVVYKFGKVVKEPHTCPTPEISKGREEKYAGRNKGDTRVL